MKRSKLLSALILIVSVLLLSAATKGNETPSPRPNQKPNEHSQFTESYSGKQPTPFHTANPSDGPYRANTSNEKESRTSDTSTVVIKIFTVVSGIAAAFIALFNWQLVAVTKEMKEVTLRAAKAAQEGVRLGERALSIDRPMIRTEIPEMKNFYETSENIRAICKLKNWGKGPGFITEVRGHLGIVQSIDEYPLAATGEEDEDFLEEGSPKREFPVELNLTDMMEIVKVLKDVLLPEEISESLAFNLRLPLLKEEDEDAPPRERRMTPELFASLTDPFGSSSNNYTVMLKTVVRYVDVAQNPYWTEFNWKYHPGSDADDGVFYLVNYKDSHQQ